MSNSKLVNYTKLSPNCNKPRNHKIDTITIHHMASIMSVEACGGLFASPSYQVSSNYGIDSKGRVGLYVDEANRSWCSASPSNDNRAVTIEVSNDVVGGNWHVSDKALAKLIDLCTDICKRNGIKKLNYTGDTKGNLTMHKWFYATECPGKYLESKFPYIANEVNKRLSANITKTATTKTTTKAAFKSYKVKITANALNIRKGAGTGYAITGSVKRGEVYTIVAESSGKGAKKWGKLKSGAGWIALEYTQKV